MELLSRNSVLSNKSELHPCVTEGAQVGDNGVHSRSPSLLYPRGVGHCAALHPYLGALPEELLPVGGRYVPGIDKLWPRGQIWPAVCLYMAHEPRMIFIFLTVYCLWLLCALRAEASSCDRGCMSHKT